MDDMLDIPEFLRRPPPTPEDMAKLRRKRYGLRGGKTLSGESGFAQRRDKNGNAIPRNMDESTKAFLADIEKAERAKAREAEAEKQERFRVLAANRAEQARIKREAKEASKANATKY